LGAQYDAAPRYRWRRQRHLVERILAEQLELGSGLHHERIAILTQEKNLSVVRPW
jgi:hypothetical protein